MPELLAALHDEQLRDLRGWGETSERNLARAIRGMQEGGGRMPLAVALDIAEDSGRADRRTAAGGASRLRGITAADARHRRRHRPVGGRRRGPGLRHGALLQHAVSGSRPGAGPHQVSVVTTKGIQVDLRVVPAAVWGAALQYFTGSKAHNIRIRELAVRPG